jgi:glycerate 2-kinase
MPPLANTQGVADTRSILVAPDSFKGSFTATQIAAAIAQGAERGGARVDSCPLADGGEGTMAAMYSARGGSIHRRDVRGPLGQSVAAAFLMLDRHTAMFDSAAASGLPLVDPALRDPLAASTAGTGELILAARDAGASHILIAAGGSASTDGGSGAIAAIDAGGGLSGARLTVLCDVQTPFEQAATVFAPQKGADVDQVLILRARLERLARSLPRDPRGRAMTGSAGGLAGGLWAAYGAELVPGAPFLFEALEVEPRLRHARAAITGEGQLDEQSFEGKLVGELSLLCTRVGVPLHAVVGRNARTPRHALPASIVSVRQASTLEALIEVGTDLARQILATS